MNDLLIRVSQSFTMQNSLVSFVPPLVLQYAEGALSFQELRTLLAKQTREQKFFFAHMPKDEIANNHRLFHHEFVFADDVNDAVEKAEEEAKRAIVEAAIKYLESVNGGPQ